MKIAVNTRLLLKDRLEGIGWFTYETMQRITQSHPEHEFFFLFDRKYSDEFIFSNNITPVIVPPPARHPLLHYLWFEHSIPKTLSKIKPDVFISPDAYCSLSTRVKTLIVIHDINFEHYPEHLPWLIRKYYRYYTPKFARRADRIATVSSYSKNDIINQYNIEPDKIDVVYNGVNEIYKPSTEKEKNLLKSELTNGEEYFLFIGALNPRKNLINLFKAFDMFKTNTGSPHKLVVVGEKMYWPRDIKTTFDTMHFKKEVIFTGRLGIDKLTKFVGSAVALTFVSFFEGFGIPIVEAFSAGTPVITSNRSSMPEVAGEAALLADPFNVEEIAGAMQLISDDERLRKTLVEKGLERAKQFSWEKASVNLWNSVLKTINN